MTTTININNRYKEYLERTKELIEDAQSAFNKAKAELELLQEIYRRAQDLYREGGLVKEVMDNHAGFSFYVGDMASGHHPNNTISKEYNSRTPFTQKILSYVSEKVGVSNDDICEKLVSNEPSKFFYGTVLRKRVKDATWNLERTGKIKKERMGEKNYYFLGGAEENNASPKIAKSTAKPYQESLIEVFNKSKSALTCADVRVELLKEGVDLPLNNISSRVLGLYKKGILTREQTPRGYAYMRKQ
jgi:hypothetical protein